MAGKRFENQENVNAVRTFAEIRRWRRERRLKTKDLSYAVPQAEAKDIVRLRNNLDSASVTWIGHSTFLLQLDGVNVLTDPVWAMRMGLERRLTQPGLALDELPRIDAVLLSHSHYDHMHMQSLKALQAAYPELALYVPEGLEAKLRSAGFGRVKELKWWDQAIIGGRIEVHFVPAQHWTRRSLFDMNSSHWGGYVLRRMNGIRPDETLYFVGDSGYFGGFTEIGKRFGPKWVLMPVGAYEPEWFMSTQHVNPEEAVQAFLDCGAAYFVPMHYGAFRLADDTPREALDRLLAEWDRRGLESARLQLPALGETIWLPS